MVLHRFHYLIGQNDFGGTTDLAVFGALATLQKGTLSGKLIDPLVIRSQIYDGMTTRYWIYVPAQYDPRTPIAMMLFQNGHGPINRDRDHPFLNTLDNLMMQKKVPLLLCVFVDPGEISETDEGPTAVQVKRYAKEWDRTLNQSMRSLLYDIVSDRYSRFLQEELLPEVEAKYNVRKDSYSRAIAGASSGGICSFNVAWQAPSTFSRVLSWVGSFTSMQWQEDPAIRYGGQDFPDLVMRGPKRNIRVWLQDGNEDMEGQLNERLFGSWPAANIRMANALKAADYDFHFSFGVGSHNAAHGAMQLPDSLQWLWRDYDPLRTTQTYTMDQDEKSKPGFRLGVVNREMN